MGICESANNQNTNANQPTTPATTAQVPNPTANTTENQGLLSNLTNKLGTDNTQQQSSGIVDTVKNALTSDQNNQQKADGGVVQTITNAIGGNTTNNAQPSKIDTVKKVVQFGVENKEALGNLVK